MFVKNREMFIVKRFLFQNKGICMPFNTLGEHKELGISNYLVTKALKTLTSKGYLEKTGVWQHAWYFVTVEGNKMLEAEVGLPEENMETQEVLIKA